MDRVAAETVAVTTAAGPLVRRQANLPSLGRQIRGSRMTSEVVRGGRQIRRPGGQPKLDRVAGSQQLRKRMAFKPASDGCGSRLRRSHAKDRRAVRLQACGAAPACGRPSAAKRVRAIGALPSRPATAIRSVQGSAAGTSQLVRRRTPRSEEPGRSRRHAPRCSMPECP